MATQTARLHLFLQSTCHGTSWLPANRPTPSMSLPQHFPHSSGVRRLYIRLPVHQAAKFFTSSDFPILLSHWLGLRKLLSSHWLGFRKLHLHVARPLPSLLSTIVSSIQRPIAQPALVILHSALAQCSSDLILEHTASLSLIHWLHCPSMALTPSFVVTVIFRLSTLSASHGSITHLPGSPSQLALGLSRSRTTILTRLAAGVMTLPGVQPLSVVPQPPSHWRLVPGVYLSNSCTSDSLPRSYDPSTLTVRLLRHCLNTATHNNDMGNLVNRSSSTPLLQSYIFRSRPSLTTRTGHNMRGSLLHHRRSTTTNRPFPGPPKLSA